MNYIERSYKFSLKNLFTFRLSVGHAQAAVTNEVFKYLGEPKTFLFCPTEYCATRATPNVTTSEYLKTLGEKLHPSIDVMWTGPQVGLARSEGRFGGDYKWMSVEPKVGAV